MWCLDYFINTTCSSRRKQMNPIKYLQSKGFKISSDPSKYSSGIWGLRNYTQYDPVKKYWINHDAYSDGYHNAYDLYREDGAPLPAVVDGTIVDGTRQNGNFGGTIVLADNKGDYQYIYGHCKNLRVKVGDKVKQGDILGYQSNTNYAGVYMDSHLHFQTQKQQYYANEKTFVKTGINPLGIDVNDYVESASETYTVKKGDTLFSISRKYGMAVDELMKINELKNHVIHPGDKLKTKKSVAVTPAKKPAVSKPKAFNKYENRYRREDEAWFKGAAKLAEVRKRSGSQKAGFNWDKKAGYDIPTGEEVFIFEVHNGWGRIYRGELTGKGSNDWIHLDRLNVTKVFHN